MEHPLKKEVTDEKLRFFRAQLLVWSKEHGRHFPWRADDADEYAKIVVEILLQRTRAERVALFFPGFLSNFPSWESIANTPEEKIEEALKPLGLWKQRAPRIIGLARAVLSTRGQWPNKREELNSLPGVGQYIANAVLLLIHGQAEPLMDASMARLIRRFFGQVACKADIRYDQELHTLTYRVLNEQDAKWLNWGMLDIAALICKPRIPNCGICPLKPQCYFFKQVQTATDHGN